MHIHFRQYCASGQNQRRIKPHSLFTVHFCSILNMLFQRFRARRSSKSKNNKSSIFRQQKNKGQIDLKPTFSTDSEATSVSTTNRSVHAGNGDGYTNHLLEAYKEKYKIQMEEIQELHVDQMIEKEEEVSRCIGLQKLTESKLAEAQSNLHRKDQVIANLEEQLSNREAQLKQVETALAASKEQLHVVSSILIQTQHLLHEKMQQLGLAESIADLSKGICQFFLKP